MVRYILVIYFILISKASFPQQVYTGDQINRLADAGKLWGYLKYHHPYLQYKNINWDSAFVAIVPEIILANSKNEYTKCIGKLLRTLQDPVTSVIELPISLPEKIKFSDLVIEDSIMIITHYDDRVIDIEGNANDLFEKARNQLKNISAVIFDMRPDPNTFMSNGGPAVLQSALPELSILPKLFTGAILMPGIRTVPNKTFISEFPESNSDYQSPFQIDRKNPMMGTGVNDIRMVFITNKYSVIPLQVVALQRAGKAFIVQEDGTGETGLVPDAKFYIADNVLLRARLGEIIDSKNGLGFQPDLVIKQSPDRREAVEASKKLLKKIEIKIPSTLPLFGGFESIHTGKSLTTAGYPSIGERVLSTAKIYTVFKYFYRSKHLWKHNWDSLYIQFLTRQLYVKDSLEYLRAVVEMHGFIQDGHGFIRQHSRQGPIRTEPGIPPPFLMRLVEQQLAVTAILNDSLCKSIGIYRGDIIVEKDGIDVNADINEKRKYFSASNYDAQSRLITNAYLVKLPGQTTELKLKDVSGKIKSVTLPYMVRSQNEINLRADLRLKGNTKPVMYFVTKDIGYVNLAALKPNEEDVDSMFNYFKDTKAIIFDLRPYPSGAHYLIAPRIGVVFGGGKKDLPGRDFEYYLDNKDRGPIYKGKTICLIDENTISAGETAAGMFYKSTLIGNHTAGANGPVLSFFVPGEIMLSSTSVFVAGQGAGLQPHVLVTPTIKGIQQDKDEILERAVKFIETGNSP